MDYVELDICEPIDVIDNDSFEMVIDKACLDSVLCHQRPYDRVPQMMDNIYRILAPGGVYICVSNGIPETRETIFKMKEWEIERGEIPIKLNAISENKNRKISTRDISSSACHYVYVMTK